MVVSGGLAGGIRRAQFPTQLYLFASWGVGASGGHQTDIFITSKHKYTNTKTDTDTNTNTYTKTDTNEDTSAYTNTDTNTDTDTNADVYAVLSFTW